MDNKNIKRVKGETVAKESETLEKSVAADLQKDDVDMDKIFAKGQEIQKTDEETE